MGLLIKLQNGDTALKSLKFGKDKPGGGDSGQPYIQNPIPNELSPESKDFLYRGGSNTLADAAQDVVRLTKYMFDLKSPSGLLFIAKQNLLSRTAPKTETSGILNGGVYTPLSTIAQAGVGFTGIHLNKQGIDPTGLIPGLSIRDYEKVAFNNNSEENNIELGSGNVVFKNRLLEIWQKKQVTSTESTDVRSYGGGPNSSLGVGKTYIEFAKDGNGAPLRTGINNSLAKSNPKFFYEGGPVRLKSSGPDQDRVDYYNTLGASFNKDFTLTGAQLGLTLEGGIAGNRYFGPEDTNKTIGKYNPTGLSLSGSNGYQANRDIALTNHKSGSAKYISPINTILNNSGLGITTGVSGSGRQIITNPKYDPTQGTFVPQSFDGKNLGEYSSENTIWNDNLKEDYTISPKNHKKGYLANLDKNAGYYIDSSGNYTYALAQYPRNIAPDFRKTNRKVRGFTDYSIGEENGNILGSYDYLTTNGTDYINGDAKIIDKIYYSSAQTRSSNILGLDNDLITFKFDIINPTNPNSTPETLNFRAYIDNFSDSYNSEWKSQTYMGRAEKFYKYDSFDRSISLGFTIVADNKTNLGKMYEQLNTLAASLAPTYTTYGYMAGNLHRLTVGNYVVNQVGIMDGLTYEVIDESPWEIESGNQLPMYIRVTGIKFTPIHNFRPETLWDKPQHQFIDQPNQ